MAYGRVAEASGYFGSRRHLEVRLRAWAGYERRRPQRQTQLSPTGAVASVGFLSQLLPPASRQRPIDPQGAAALHRALAGLRGDP